ncbi:MAG: antifreeze protein [Octadecabacter sp.]
MSKPPSPFDYWANAIQLGHVMAESQAVIGMRLMGMAGVWSVTAGENDRMISEKMDAMTKGMTAAGAAAMRGKSPDQITAAAIKPIRQKTRANHKRLAKRGLKGA